MNTRQRQFHRIRRERDKLASAILAHQTLWRNTGDTAAPPSRSKTADALRDADRKLYARYDEVMGR